MRPAPGSACWRPRPRRQRWCKRLQQEVAKALASPAVKERLLAQGAIPGGNSSADFVRMIDSEHRKWAQVVKAAGAKVD
jgi:tripartite-type tricarboxylate transporter receptor subunit TctC